MSEWFCIRLVKEKRWGRKGGGENVGEKTWGEREREKGKMRKRIATENARRKNERAESNVSRESKRERE